MTVPPVTDFDGDELSETATRALFDIEDAELPGMNGTATDADSSGITPDHTASRPQRSARTPRAGSLRERFASARARRGGGSVSPDNTSPRPTTRQRAQRPAKPPKRIPNRRGQFVKPLTQFYTLVGIATTSKDAVCGPAVIQNAESCARAIDDLAQDTPWLREFLWNATQTGKWGKVGMAHAPIIFAVGMHHSPRFRNTIDHSGMGEFVAKLMVDQAESVRQALAEEEARENGGD